MPIRKPVGAVLAVLLAVTTIGSATPAAASPVPATIASAEFPVGLAEDSSGNVFIASDNDPTSAMKGLVVVPAASGTIFGQAVTAGAQHLLAPEMTYGVLRGVAVNANDDVLFSTSSGAIYALTSSAQTVFGVVTTANTPTLVKSGTDIRGGIAFDSAGNLFGIGLSTGIVAVLPAATGTVFGVSVTANTPARIVNGSYWLWDLAVDATGNLVFTSGWSTPPGVYVLPRSTGTLYGESVTANVPALLTAFNTDIGNGAKPAGIDVDSAGSIYVTYWGTVVAVLTTSATSMFGESVPALTVTQLAATGGYANQGTLIASDGSLVLGGGGGTYRLAPFSSYTVIFDGNALDATGTMTSQVDSSAAALSLNQFARPGYTFAGWATSSTGVVMYADGAIYPFTSGTTLYARWAAPGTVVEVYQRPAPPPDVLQSVGRSGETCDGIDDTSLNWAGTRSGGWTPSWEQWANGGTGGFVCNRTLRYDQDREHWFTVRS